MKSYTFVCEQSDTELTVKADTIQNAMFKANIMFRPVWTEKNISFYAWMENFDGVINASYGVWD